MDKILVNISIFLIKVYKYLLSPLLGNKCRFLPSCSEYFIESLLEHGLFKGLFGCQKNFKMSIRLNY